jgi:hypothetical protein
MNIGGSGATDNCLVQEITGQSDKDVNTGQIILVKMSRPSAAGKDLFLMYNKKSGINSGTVEGGNMVTVVEADGEGTAYGESWLVAKLGIGDVYTASNYLGAGKDLVITVLSIGNAAHVRIEYDDLCTRTMAPTPSPCGDTNQKQVTIQIKTDNYPTETSWTLKKFGSCVGQTDPNLSGGGYSSANTLQTVFQRCVDKGQYQFVISDSYGDGICCGKFVKHCFHSVLFVSSYHHQAHSYLHPHSSSCSSSLATSLGYGTGSFQVLYGETDVFPGQSGDFGSSFTGTFGECNAAPATPPPTPPPVNPPTAKPTPNPTKNPTVFPTNPPPTPNPTNLPTPNPTTPPTPNPTLVPTNPPTNAPTNSPTFPPPTSLPTPPPTPAPVSIVNKYICVKRQPLDSTICVDGSLAGGTCSSENVGERCGSKGRVCWWAACPP